MTYDWLLPKCFLWISRNRAFKAPMCSLSWATCPRCSLMGLWKHSCRIGTKADSGLPSQVSWHRTDAPNTPSSTSNGQPAAFSHSLVEPRACPRPDWSGTFHAPWWSTLLAIHSFCRLGPNCAFAWDMWPRWGWWLVDRTWRLLSCHLYNSP